VHHDVPEIDQRPAAIAESLDPKGKDAVFFLERFLDMLRQGDDLTVGTPGAEQEVVGVSGELPDIQRADVQALLVPGEPGAVD